MNDENDDTGIGKQFFRVCFVCQKFPQSLSFYICRMRLLSVVRNQNQPQASFWSEK